MNPKTVARYRSPIFIFRALLVAASLIFMAFILHKLNQANAREYRQGRVTHAMSSVRESISRFASNPALVNGLHESGFLPANAEHDIFFTDSAVPSVTVMVPEGTSGYRNETANIKPLSYVRSPRYLFIYSVGPDGKRGISPQILASMTEETDEDYLAKVRYEPTNGTVSGGDIISWRDLKTTGPEAAE